MNWKMKLIVIAILFEVIGFGLVFCPIQTTEGHWEKQIIEGSGHTVTESHSDNITIPQKYANMTIKLPNPDPDPSRDLFILENVPDIMTINRYSCQSAMFIITINGKNYTFLADAKPEHSCSYPLASIDIVERINTFLHKGWFTSSGGSSWTEYDYKEVWITKTITHWEYCELGIALDSIGGFFISILFFWMLCDWANRKPQQEPYQKQKSGFMKFTKCASCGKEFRPQFQEQYCSEACSKKANNSNYPTSTFNHPSQTERDVGRCPKCSGIMVKTRYGLRCEKCGYSDSSKDYVS